MVVFQMEKLLPGSRQLSDAKHSENTLKVTEGQSENWMRIKVSTDVHLTS